MDILLQRAAEFEAPFNVVEFAVLIDFVWRLINSDGNNINNNNNNNERNKKGYLEGSFS